MLEAKRSAKEEMQGTLQEFYIEKIKEAGGVAYFVYPENFEEIKTKLLDLSTKEPA